jgi:hypothetical protein
MGNPVDELHPARVPAVLAADSWDTGAELWRAAKRLVEAMTESKPVTEPKEVSKEEFFQSRRSTRQSLEEAQREAEKEARASPEYKEAMAENRRKSAEAMVQKRKESAEATWQKSQGTIGGEEERIGQQWDAELADRERRRVEGLSRSFNERHPAAAEAIPMAGLGLTALAGRFGLKKLAEKGGDIAADAVKARGAKDFQGLAEQILKAQQFKNVTRPLGTGLTVLGAPMINVESRALPDQFDRLMLPPEAGARQKAEERQSDPMLQAKESVWPYIGGLAAVMTGAKLPKPVGSPGPDIAAVTGYAKGMPKDIQAQDLAIKLAQKDRRLMKAMGGETPPLPPPTGSAPTGPASAGQIPAQAQLPAAPAPPPSGPMGAAGTIPASPAAVPQLAGPTTAAGPTAGRPPRGAPLSRPTSPERLDLEAQLQLLPPEQRLPFLLSKLGLPNGPNVGGQ